MEEEISLKEIIIMLWQGRYLIIGITAAAVVFALVASLFFVTPLYEAQNRIDLNAYEIATEDFVRCLEEPAPGEEAKEATREDVLAPVGDVEHDLEYKVDNGAVLVTVRAASPEKANRVADQIGSELFQQAGSYCLEQLQVEKDRLENFFKLLEQEKEAYSPDPGYHLERLNRKKKATEESITQLEEYIDSLRGEMELEEQLQLMEIDPSYRVLMERMGELLARHAEISMHINDVQAGRFTEELLQEDSYYVYLTEQEEELNAQLSDVIFSIRTTELTMATTPHEHYFNFTPAEDRPVNRNWPLNTAVAGVLGLMVSVFVVFARPHVRELFSADTTDEPYSVQ